MKKILRVFCFLFICIAFTGCVGTDKTTNNDVGGSSLNIHNPNFEKPFSYESTYQNPVEVEDSASKTEVSNAVLDSVVSIYIVNSFNNKPSSLGSGVAIYAGGYIVTNYHVVEDAYISSSSYHVVHFLNNQSEQYDAQILWADPVLDLAIIQSENGDIPYVNMEDRWIYGEDKLEVLEEVIAIGTPCDISFQNTVTTGFVSSNYHRHSIAEDNVYENLIQHSSAISKGNSGGGLFDMQGNLVAINTLGSNDVTDAYFSVPILPVMIIIDKVVDLNENQNKVFGSIRIGVEVSDCIIDIYRNTQTIDDKGVYITKVNSAFDDVKNNFKKGDVITAMTIDGTKYDLDNRNYLIYALLRLDIGDSIEIEFERNDVSKSCVVELSL